MTKTIKAVLIIGAFMTLMILGYAQRAGGISSVKAEATTSEKEIALKKTLGTPEQESWLKKLEMCESSGRPDAINAVDLDGTPSYGLLQFKPSTFEAFKKAYGIEGELMDPEAQRAIVRKMMSDPSVKWHIQFPACTRKLGLPPLTI